MYLLFTVLIPLFLILLCISLWRRKKIIKKIRSMCMKNKCRLLNELIEPFGYYYIHSQDIFTSRIDAWQRDFGYSAFYDRIALRFGMVFDCLPIYFDYHGKTWLLEFWKGQYGINTGCEIGLYSADRILDDGELTRTLFKSVEDAYMLRISFTLFRGDEVIARLTQRHWWHTAFCVGRFSNPSDLSLKASISFPTAEMANAFTAGLQASDYCARSISRCGNTITLSFTQSEPVCGVLRRLRIRLVQWQNCFWGKVYLSITHPFRLSVDRILYLYYYLPFAFRKTLHIRKYHKKKYLKKKFE